MKFLRIFLFSVLVFLAASSSYAMESKSKHTRKHRPTCVQRMEDLEVFIDYDIVHALNNNKSEGLSEFVNRLGSFYLTAEGLFHDSEITSAETFDEEKFLDMSGVHSNTYTYGWKLETRELLNDGRGLLTVMSEYIKGFDKEESIMLEHKRQATDKDDRRMLDEELQFILWKKRVYLSFTADLQYEVQRLEAYFHRGVILPSNGNIDMLIQMVQGHLPATMFQIPKLDPKKLH